jgi:hypothetical protein
MMLFGFPPLAVIGAGQAVQILAALSGTVANAHMGSIDLAIATPVTLLEVAGVGIGVRIVHAVDAGLLRRLVGVLCIVVGTGLTVRWVATG